MRALKTILIILGAIIGLLIILGLIGPKTSVVQRSTTIAAPADVVYPMVASLRTMHDWSPWKDMEKDQKVEFSGEDGTVGSMQMWEGDTVGKGSMEVIELEANKHVGTDLKFIEPWEAESKVDLDLEEEGDAGTKVTWKMTQQNGFMGRIMSVFMDMDKMVGPDFEKGLAKLKTMAEAKEQELAAIRDKTYNGFVIETVDRPELVYVGKRKVVKWKDMHDYFAASFGAAFKAVGAAKMEMEGAPSGLYYKWDEANKEADLMAAIPVKADADAKVVGMQTAVVPAGKALFIPYKGGYYGSGKAHEAMDQMMKAKGLELRDVVIEEYVTDPEQEPDSSKWLTNIYYMIK
ncbi:MAG: SRPBCC family protein [Flavobacteriales bacterium]|nr:SRPBCC family protein [Flavobacteriales bacterium]MCB9193872.1 SRPBCC family protein [Flavobacteriales bacterium]